MSQAKITPDQLRKSSLTPSQPSLTGNESGHRARLISGRLGVDSRHQDFVVPTVYTMERTPDLLPGTLDLLILRTRASPAFSEERHAGQLGELGRELVLKEGVFHFSGG